jgi:hypothetical protein
LKTEYLDNRREAMNVLSNRTASKVAVLQTAHFPFVKAETKLTFIFFCNSAMFNDQRIAPPCSRRNKETKTMTASFKKLDVSNHTIITNSFLPLSSFAISILFALTTVSESLLVRDIFWLLNSHPCNTAPPEAAVCLPRLSTKPFGSKSQTCIHRPLPKVVSCKGEKGPTEHGFTCFHKNVFRRQER